MSSTKRRESLERGARPGSAVARAWVSVVLILAFLLVAVVGTLLQYE